MSYTLPISLNYGAKYASATLNCNILDTSGNVTSTITSGFVNMGNGNFIFNATLADSFTGYLQFVSTANPVDTSIDIVPVSPRYAENMDVKLSALTVSASLTQTDLNNIAQTILTFSNAVETGIDVQGALRAILSATAGVVSGGGTSDRKFFAGGDTTGIQSPRITAHVDDKGNRLQITLDLA